VCPSKAIFTFLEREIRRPPAFDRRSGNNDVAVDGLRPRALGKPGKGFQSDACLEHARKWLASKAGLGLGRKRKSLNQKAVIP
ncbi:MAG: hypothetical protein EBT57_06950, partial [Verrucomicrobia bacterium]|nr:hypothetical protein [Verrucomicrobiota bacterium]